MLKPCRAGGIWSSSRNHNGIYARNQKSIPLNLQIIFSKYHDGILTIDASPSTYCWERSAGSLLLHSMDPSSFCPQFWGHNLFFEGSLLPLSQNR